MLVSEIANDIKSMYNNMEDFVVKNPIDTIVYSLVLKIICLYARTYLGIIGGGFLLLTLAFEWNILKKLPEFTAALLEKFRDFFHIEKKNMSVITSEVKDQTEQIEIIFRSTILFFKLSLKLLWFSLLPLRLVIEIALLPIILPIKFTYQCIKIIYKFNKIAYQLGYN